MSKSDFSIRPFVAADLAALHSIRKAAFAPVFDSFRELVGPQLASRVMTTAEDEQAAWLDRICQPESGHNVTLATRQDHPIGFCSWSVDHTKLVGEIGLNAVNPDHSGKGVGTALYNNALAEFRMAGMQAATVSTGGDASHAPARRAYAKAGFSAGIPSVTLYRALE